MVIVITRSAVAVCLQSLRPIGGTHLTEIGLNAPERHSLPKPYKRLFRCAAPKCYSRKHYRGFPAFPALFGHAFALLLFITAFEKL